MPKRIIYQEGTKEWKRQQYSDKLYKINKYHILERNKKWEESNKIIRAEQKRIMYIKNKEHIDKTHIDYYNKNKLELLAKQKTPDKRAKARISERNYRLRNPEKVLAKNIRKLTNLAKEKEMNTRRYQMALIDWGNLVKTRDNWKCQICNTDKNLNAHHIIYKSKHPKLSLNINNGITLCKEHHFETHGWKLNG